MNEKLLRKNEYLVKNIPKLIKEFSYRGGPDFYFHKKCINEVRNNSVKNLLRENDFIELLYATLVSWDMNARGAKMMYFDDFRENILESKEYFEELSNYKLDSLDEDAFLQAKDTLEKLYRGHL